MVEFIIQLLFGVGGEILTHSTIVAGTTRTRTATAAIDDDPKEIPQWKGNSITIC